MPITPKHYFWIVLIILLVACAVPGVGGSPTEVDMTAIFNQAAATAVSAQMTRAAMQPTPTEPGQAATPALSTPTALLTETPAPTLTQTPLPLVTVDGLRMAYIIEGNLYVQDSGEQPVKLTTSGQDRSPIFSDEGEKVVFFRGKASNPNSIYSINADGSQEQELVSASKLTKLFPGYDEFTKLSNMAFVPNTHQLLFNTSEVKPWSDQAQHMSPMDVQRNQDMLLLDIDTVEIKQLLAPGKGGIFQVSPNGKLDMVYTRNYIDVIGIYGQVDRRHMITYQPDWDYEWTEPFWTQDSSKFMFVAPIKGNADGTDGPEPNTIWEYFVDSNSAVEIRINPPPMAHYFTISPDGDWIAYSYFYYEGKTDETTPSGVYIGNLHDGSSRFLGSAQSYGLPDTFNWSPDSKYFIFDETYLGNTQGDVAPLDATGIWMGWIDNYRYLNKKDGVVMGEIGKEENVLVVDLPASLKNLYAGYFTYIYAKPK